MTQAPRHKAFVSFHNEDKKYKNYFMRMTRDDIVDRSVGEGDINKNLKVDTIRRAIRDDFIRDATVTIVLIGPCTWQRKHVDWEISSSLRDTQRNSRCGLLGILLPNHSCWRRKTINARLVPPRLADNCIGAGSYAEIYRWSDDVETIRGWIHEAFGRRNGTPPDNSRIQYRYNRSGSCGGGW